MVGDRIAAGHRAAFPSLPSRARRQGARGFYKRDANRADVQRPGLHKGQGGLYQYLKKEGLIQAISSGDKSYATTYHNYYIEVRLTDLGLKNYVKVS